MWFFGNERRHDPKPCLLKVERGEHNLKVSRKAHNLLLRQCEKHLSRHSVRARLALFQPGQPLPDITWGDFNLLGSIVQRSPPFQNTFVFGLQLQLALSRNSNLKNVSVETSDGRRRRFLPQNSQPVEVIATLPLQWRTFRLACFPQKNHSSLSSKSPSSPPQETIAPSSFNSRRSTLQLRLQIADDLIFLAFLTCLVRICSARQEPRKANGSRQSAPNSPEPPTAFSHAMGSLAVQRRAQGIRFFLLVPKTPALRTV